MKGNTNHTIIDDNWPYNPWCAYGKCISSHTSSMFDLIGMLDHSRISLTISNRPRNSRPFPGRLGLFPEHTRPSLIISWIFQTNSRPLGPFPGHLGLIFWQFWTFLDNFPAFLAASRPYPDYLLNIWDYFLASLTFPEFSEHFLTISMPSCTISRPFADTSLHFIDISRTIP